MSVFFWIFHFIEIACSKENDTFCGDIQTTRDLLNCHTDEKCNINPIRLPPRGVYAYSSDVHGFLFPSVHGHISRTFCIPNETRSLWTPSTCPVPLSWTTQRYFALRYLFHGSLNYLLLFRLTIRFIFATTDESSNILLRFFSWPIIRKVIDFLWISFCHYTYDSRIYNPMGPIVSLTNKVIIKYGFRIWKLLQTQKNTSWPQFISSVPPKAFVSTHKQS